jgi:hypothetical protein
MNRILNAEEVLDLMLNHVSLSRYDQKFFYNLQLTNVLPRKAITSNQAALFTKVVKKYKKQLSTLNYDADQLSEISWTLPIIQSSPEFTHAQISVENNELILRCPFKQAFVQEFRDHSVMVWNREKRLYNTEYGLYKLKLIINCVMKHYNEIKFCDTIQNIINEISIYDESQCWDPTLVKCNDRLYIANLNESLNNATKHIELSTSLNTLAILCSYGIKISYKLQKQLLSEHSIEDLHFAVNRQVTHEVSDVEGLAEKLKKINCDYALHASLMYAKEDVHDFAKALVQHINFPVETSNMRKITWNSNKYEMPVLLKSMSSYSFAGFGSPYAAKVINLVNSNPIEIK